MSRSPRLTGSTLALLFVCALSAGGQALPPALPPALPAAPSFGERIDVRVVNVEAVVTDREGGRVRGLTAADFRLLVDDKEMPISYFTEIADGKAAAPAPGAPPTASPLAAGETVGTSYLVFVDNSFVLAAHRNIVLDRLAADLARLGPEDRMAIVAFDGRRLSALSPWSGDRVALATAFTQARNLPTLGPRAYTERAGVAREQQFNRDLQDQASSFPSIGDSRNGGRQPGTGTPVSSGASILRLGESPGASTAPALRGRPGHCVLDFPISQIQCVELEEAIAAAASALTGFPTPGGRKVMLLLAGGWPYGAGPHLYQPLVETANQLGYTLYPVDVPGIDPGTGVVDASLTRPATGFVNGRWERESKDALEVLAIATGGKAILNSARLDALPRTAADTRSYYWLGFAPVWKADNRHHEIKLTVRRPGLAVRARSSFTDLSQRAADGMRAASLVLLGGAGEDRRLRIETGEPAKAGLGVVEVPVTLVVPLEALTLADGAQGYVAEAMMSLAVQDASGGSADFPDIPLRFNLPGAPPPGSFARYRTKLKLRKGGQRLVVMVRDATTGAALWDERKLDL